MELLQVGVGVALALAFAEATHIGPGLEVASCLKGYEEGGSAKQCIPFDRPESCSEEAWRRLATSMNSPSLLLVGPPSYLNIDGFADCLSDDGEEFCLPSSRPEECPEDHWTQVVDRFDGERCPEEEVRGLIGGIGGLPPAYLNIENHEKCLGSQSEGTYTSYCKLAAKPVDCERSTFQRVNEVFEGDVCSGQQPGYLPVEDAGNCLKEYNASATRREACLPMEVPGGCPQPSFLRLVATAFRQRLTYQGKIIPYAEMPVSPPKVACEDRTDCRDDQACFSVGFGSYCVPDGACEDVSQCPLVGNLLDGMLEGRCGDENKCFYGPEVIFRER